MGEGNYRVYHSIIPEATIDTRYARWQLKCPDLTPEEIKARDPGFGMAEWCSSTGEFLFQVQPSDNPDQVSENPYLFYDASAPWHEEIARRFTLAKNHVPYRKYESNLSYQDEKDRALLEGVRRYRRFLTFDGPNNQFPREIEIYVVHSDDAGGRPSFFGAGREGFEPENARNNGIILGSENLSFSRFVSEHLIEDMTPEERQMVIEDFERAYRETLDKPETPAALLSPETTDILKTKTSEKYAELSGKKSDLLAQTDAFIQELVTHFQTQQDNSTNDSDRSWHRMGKLAIERERPEGKQKASIRANMKYLSELEKEIGESYSHFRYTPKETKKGFLARIDELYWELNDFIEEDSKPHKQAYRFDQELQRTGDQLAIIVPKLYPDYDSTAVYEGEFSTMPRNVDKWSYVNAKAKATDLLEGPLKDLSWNPGEVLYEDTTSIGTFSKVKVEVSVDGITTADVIPAIDRALQSLNIPEAYKDDYVGTIAETTIKRVRVISYEEMQSRAQHSAKSLLVSGLKYLYDNPKHSKDMIYTAASTYESVPIGLFSGDTIYLLGTDSEGRVTKGHFEETFAHEFGHAQNQAYSIAGIMPEGVFNGEVKDEMYSRLRKDRSVISDHAFVKKKLPGGVYEWDTDAKVAFWQDPQHLRRVDPDWYYFNLFLHNDVQKVTHVIEEAKPAVIDDDGNIVTEAVPAVTETKYWLKPVNPFEGTQDAREQRLANAIESLDINPEWLRRRFETYNPDPS